MTEEEEQGIVDSGKMIDMPEIYLLSSTFFNYHLNPRGIFSVNKSIGYEKAFKFSVRIVNLYKYLCSKEREYIISKQILRSGKSIGANINEASQAQSKKDFLSKMNIASKEASDTEYCCRQQKQCEKV